MKIYNYIAGMSMVTRRQALATLWGGCAAAATYGASVKAGKMAAEAFEPEPIDSWNLFTSIRSLYAGESIIATEDEKDQYAANLTDFVMQFENDASDRDPDYRNAGLSMLLNAWSGKEILRSSKDYSYKAVGQWGLIDLLAGHLTGIVTKPALLACMPNQDGNSLVLSAMRANKLPDQYESAMRNILLRHTLEREKFMTHGRCTASSAATVSAVGALKFIMDR